MRTPHLVTTELVEGQDDSCGGADQRLPVASIPRSAADTDVIGCVAVLHGSELRLPRNTKLIGTRQASHLDLNILISLLLSIARKQRFRSKGVSLPTSKFHDWPLPALPWPGRPCGWRMDRISGDPRVKKAAFRSRPGR